jgi:DNA polymerase family A
MKQSLLHIQYLRSLHAAFLADMEFTPHHLDAARVTAEYNKQLDIAMTAHRELEEIADGCNLNSRPQTAILLYDKLGFAELTDAKGQASRTPSGGRKSDDATLASLGATTEAQKRFIDSYRRRNKAASLLSKNLNYFKQCVDTCDGMMWPEYHQLRTVNHRLGGGSRKIPFTPVFSFGKNTKTKLIGAQAQNIPRQYKKLFTAPDGYLVAEPDGSQLEFRLGVDMSLDERGLLDILNKEDAHRNTAQAFTDAGDPKFIALKDDFSKWRTAAKAQTFQPMYGGRGSSKYEKAYREFFVTRYAGMNRMQERWCREVITHPEKALVLPYGMVYYFPDAKVVQAKFKGGTPYISGSTNIYNYGISGLSTAEAMPIASICLWHRVRNMRTADGKSVVIPFSVIHDSSPCYVAEGYEEQARQVFKVAFTKDVVDFLRKCYNYDVVVPLGAGVKISKHWADTKQEVSFDYDANSQTWTREEKT